MGKTVKDRESILRRAIEVYGVRSQQDMMIEESSELNKAILKLRRATDAIEIMHLEADVREEMADVQIMLDQMKIIYGIPEAEEEYKLNRLSERLDNHV